MTGKSPVRSCVRCLPLGGVNWNGFSLEDLIKMVAERASPQQLDALAGEWRQHGGSITQASGDLQRSLDKLMEFWSGDAADESAQKVGRVAVATFESRDLAKTTEFYATYCGLDPLRSGAPGGSWNTSIPKFKDGRSITP